MKDYHSKVKQILEAYPATRDDDMLLYGVFLANHSSVSPTETFYYVCQTAQARGLPSYESISRARRKIQEQEPSLRGTRRDVRMAEEEEYHEYYRNN